MHVAWLGKKTPFCGNVTYGREVTNALLDRGHLVSFLHFEAAHQRRAEQRPQAEIVLPCLYKSQIYTLPSFESRKVLTRSLQELTPDVVHASLTLSPLDFQLPEICQALNLPLIATFHPAFDRKVRTLKSSTQYFAYQLYAPFLARYDRVIIFSQAQRELLIRLGVPPEKVVVIPNGVDVEKYTPGPATWKARLETSRLFVYMGRISAEKNVEALLKAWRAARMGDRAKLFIVGDGPLRSLLEQNYGITDNVLWHGFEGNETRRIEILRSADVFVLPSLVEGLSLALLEAMACGVACLATDAGADGEVLADGAGIVMDTQQVSNQLKTLLPLCCEHPELTQLLGLKARQRVLAEYTLSHNIAQIESQYHQLLRMPTVGYSYRSWASS
ncbi:MAG: glycosyltransferase family 4 protein [Spirulina sp. SIO3F2]|nr:glycosyltransferase family 4 protein [Spirulina sp. SIO3F2]